MSICPLSERQLEAVRKASEGKITKTIAHEMGTSLNVIGQYLHISRLKAGTETTTGLVAKAIREGWIE